MLLIFLLSIIGMGMAATCPEHSRIMQDSTRIWCIWFSTAQSSAAGLVQMCEDGGGLLFTIEDAEVQSYLEEVLDPELRRDGITDILINYYTVTGSTFEDVPQTYTRWPTGVQQGNNKCVKTSIEPGNFYWDTIPCRVSMFGVCYKAMDCPAKSMLVSNNTKCFWTTTNLTDAHGGQDNCLADGGTLAVISNSDLNDELIANHLPTIINANEMDGQNEDIWIGVTDQDVEGVYTTWSGEPVSFLNWYPSQPNDYKTAIDQDCVKIIADSNLQWEDMPCNYQGISLCSKDLAHNDVTAMAPTPTSINERTGTSDMTSLSTTMILPTPSDLGVSQTKRLVVWSLFVLVSENMVPDPTLHEPNAIYYLHGSIECARKCQEVMSCVSFTFDLVTGEIGGGCHLYESVFDSDLVYKTESRYFRKVGNI